MKIELRNCGIVKSASLEFVNGLNLILGPSSSGKSTLFRVIRSFIDNSFSDSQVSIGHTQLGVKIIDNGHEYVYVRNLGSRESKSQYSIDGKIFQKVGRTPLLELISSLRLSSIVVNGIEQNFNFNSQFAGPFLLLSSPSVLYSVLSYHSGVEISKLYDCYKTDLRKTKVDITVSEGVISQLEESQRRSQHRLDSLEDFPKSYSELNSIEQIFAGYDQLRVLTDQLRLIQSLSIIKCEFYNSQYYFLSKLSSRTLDLPKLETYIDFTSEYCILANYESYSKSQGVLEFYSFEWIQLYNQLHELVSCFSETTQLLTSVRVELTSIKEELATVEICPLCGSSIRSRYGS